MIPKPHHKQYWNYFQKKYAEVKKSKVLSPVLEFNGSLLDTQLWLKEIKVSLGLCHTGPQVRIDSQRLSCNLFDTVNLEYIQANDFNYCFTKKGVECQKTLKRMRKEALGK